MPDYERWSDERLVLRVRDGDEAAFQVLTDRYSQKLLARIERRLRPGMTRKIAASDVLYGVTMPEEGISSVVSMRLDKK